MCLHCRRRKGEEYTFTSVQVLWQRTENMQTEKNSGSNKRKARALHKQVQVTAGCRTGALSQFSAPLPAHRKPFSLQHWVKWNTGPKLQSSTLLDPEEGTDWPKTEHNYKHSTIRHQKCLGSGHWAQLLALPQILLHKFGQRWTTDKMGRALPCLLDALGRLVRPSDNVTSRIK